MCVFIRRKQELNKLKPVLFIKINMCTHTAQTEIQMDIARVEYLILSKRDKMEKKKIQ